VAHPLPCFGLSICSSVPPRFMRSAIA
jgi:hypothetical protein